METQVLDRSLVMDAVSVAEEAAIAAWALVGRGDEMAADQAAVDAMRTALNDLEIDGVIVIGEGERDEAPMLYIGEKVGKGGPAIDIALDPLEGTSLTAKAMANALAVMAWAPEGHPAARPRHLYGQDRLRSRLPRGRARSRRSARRTTRVAIAAAKGVAVTEITACVLDRPRHTEIIASLREGRRAGAPDHRRRRRRGDEHRRPRDGHRLLRGPGRRAGRGAGLRGAEVRRWPVPRPAGVPQQRRAGAGASHGVTDLDKKYDLHEMVRSDAIFVATGVTDGALLQGVKFKDGFVHTHTLVMNSASRTVREVRMKRRL